MDKPRRDGRSAQAKATAAGEPTPLSQNAPSAAQVAPLAGPSSDVRLFNQEHRRRYAPGERTGQEFQFTMYLVLASRRWRARVADQLRAIGQTTARWEALFTVAYADGEITQNRMARRLAIEGPTLVRMLHKLEAEGLVKRIASTGHRGAKRIVMTDAGRKLILQIDDITRGLREDLLRGLTDAEIDAGMKLLRRLSDRFRTETDEG